MRIPIALSLMFFSANLHAQVAPFEHYKIDIRSKRVNFFETIEHIEFIRLEETEKSLLPEFSMALNTTAGIAIPDSESNKVYLFDKNGNYKNSIDRFGQGPDEYKSISSIWFRKGFIELYSGLSRILQRYTLDGKYVESIKAQYPEDIRGGTMVPFEDGYLFQALDRSVLKRTENNLFFVDDSLKMIFVTGSANNNNPFPINLGKRFAFLNGELIYKKILTDSVFLIENKKLKPFMKFDFGDEWAWNDPISRANIKNASKTVIKGSKVYEVLPDIGEKYIVLTYYYELRKTGMGFVNRETGKFSRFDLRKKDKENYDIKFLQWENDRLGSSIQAYDFEEFVENLHEDQFTIRGGFRLEDILSSENPVLMKIKFK